MFFLQISAILGSLLLLEVDQSFASTGSGICSHAGFGYSKWGKSEKSTKEWPGVCQTGRRQSPINIQSQHKGRNKKQLSFRGYNAYLKDYTLTNNGHAVQVSLSPKDSKRIGINLEGRFYNLLQFHFHWPSEHKIDNKRFPLEMHLVHQHQRTKQLAVVAVLHKFKRGQTSVMLKKFSKLLPYVSKPSERKMNKVWTGLRLSGFLSKQTSNPDYYRYEGSLTTPPCTEGVHWVVLKEPAVIHWYTYKNFLKLHRCHTAGTHEHKGQKASQDEERGNYRPIQKLNGRRVKLY